jgi:PAS domain S-box-containing protein
MHGKKAGKSGDSKSMKKSKASLIFINLSLLRTRLSLIVKGLIITAIFCGFCVITIFAKYEYTIPEAVLVCCVYLLVLSLTVVHEYVRSIKDRWFAQQDDYLQMVFDNSPDIIMLLDKDIQLVYCARVFLEKTGIKSFKEIRKTSYLDVFSRYMQAEQLNEFTGLFHASKEGMNPIKFERTMDFSDNGNLRHYEIHFTPMYNKLNIFQGAFIMFHDMTEIFEAKERTEQASRAKSNFLANMSHEIRTPLNAIIAMTTIARDSNEQSQKENCLNKIESASVHLLGIINDILDMSKIEENKFELSRTEFEFSSMIQRVANIFEFRLSEKKQYLAIELDPSIPSRLIADEQRLAQVITNLIGNAIKFTPDTGDIQFSIRRLKDTEESFCILEIRVTDTGIGIPKEQQSKLFQSFVQVDSSIARRFGGTGLGLAISKKIVELMHGEIRIESEEDKGASFIFTIRAEIPAASSAEAAGNTGDAEPEKQVDFQGKRILLAEDVEINREIVITVLEPLGIEIIEAEDGQKAFDLFRENPETIDLIFMDIHMPVINGYESAKLIRAHNHPKAKTIPIIAMTANVFKEDVERCLAAGMNAHVGKPVDFDALMTVLGKYLADNHA